MIEPLSSGMSLVQTFDIAIAVTFALAAAPKLSRTGQRLLALDTNRRLGISTHAVFGRVAAGIITLAEIAIVITASTHDVRGRIGALALSMAFLLGDAVNISSGRRLACNCFGSGKGTAAWPALWRDVGIVVMAAASLAVGHAASGNDFAISGPNILLYTATVLGVATLINVLDLSGKSEGKAST